MSRLFLLVALVVSSVFAQVCVYKGSVVKKDSTCPLQTGFPASVLEKRVQLLERQIVVVNQTKANVQATPPSEEWTSIESILRDTLVNSSISTNVTKVLWTTFNASVQREAVERERAVNVLESRIHQLEQGISNGILELVSCPARSTFSPATGQCECIEGYSGIVCSIPVCNSCVHGLCIAPNECQCDRGYSGNGCDVPVCSQECKNGGVCVAPNRCGNCDEGYTGIDCGSSTSPSVRLVQSYDDSMVLQRQGSCSGAGVVQVWSGVRWGTMCSDQFSSLEADVVCRTVGYEKSASVLITDDRFLNSTDREREEFRVILSDLSCVGNESSIFECTSMRVGRHRCSAESSRASVVCSPCQLDCPQACRGRGRCVGDHLCACNAGFTGESCETSVCSPPCQGGQCVAPDVCSCEEGFFGNDCSAERPALNVSSGLLGRTNGGDVSFYLHRLYNPSLYCEGIPYRANEKLSESWPVVDVETASPFPFQASSLCQALGFNGSQARLEALPSEIQMRQQFHLGVGPYNASKALSNELFYLQCDECVSLADEFEAWSTQNPFKAIQRHMLKRTEELCSFHGFKTSQGCQCTIGWAGSTCEQPVCSFGCSGHGSCVLPELCSCVDGYTGASCEVVNATATEGRVALFAIPLLEEGLRFGIAETYYHAANGVYPVLLPFGSEQVRVYKQQHLCERLGNSSLLRFNISNDDGWLANADFPLRRWVESSSFSDGEDMVYHVQSSSVAKTVHMIACLDVATASSGARRLLCSDRGEARFDRMVDGIGYVPFCKCDFGFTGQFCDRERVGTAAVAVMNNSKIEGVSSQTNMVRLFRNERYKGGIPLTPCVPHRLLIYKSGRQAFIYIEEDRLKAMFAQAACRDLGYDRVHTFFDEFVHIDDIDANGGIWYDVVQCELEDCSEDIEQFFFGAANPATSTILAQRGYLALSVQCDCIEYGPKALRLLNESQSAYISLPITVTANGSSLLSLSTVLSVEPNSSFSNKLPHVLIDIMGFGPVPLTVCNSKEDGDNIGRILNAVRADLLRNNYSMGGKLVLFPTNENTDGVLQSSPILQVFCPEWMSYGAFSNDGLTSCELLAVRDQSSRVYYKECATIQIGDLVLEERNSESNTSITPWRKVYLGRKGSDNDQLLPITIEHRITLDAPGYDYVDRAEQSCREYNMTFPTVRSSREFDVLFPVSADEPVPIDGRWDDYNGYSQGEGWSLLKDKPFTVLSEEYVSRLALKPDKSLFAPRLPYGGDRVITMCEERRPAATVNINYLPSFANESGIPFSLGRDVELFCENNSVIPSMTNTSTSVALSDCSKKGSSLLCRYDATDNADSWPLSVFEVPYNQSCISIEKHNFRKADERYIWNMFGKNTAFMMLYYCTGQYCTLYFLEEDESLGGYIHTQYQGDRLEEANNMAVSTDGSLVISHPGNYRENMLIHRRDKDKRRFSVIQEIGPFDYNVVAICLAADDSFIVVQHGTNLLFIYFRDVNTGLFALEGEFPVRYWQVECGAPGHVFVGRYGNRIDTYQCSPEEKRCTLLNSFRESATQSIRIQRTLHNFQDGAITLFLSQPSRDTPEIRSGAFEVYRVNVSSGQETLVQTIVEENADRDYRFGGDRGVTFTPDGQTLVIPANGPGTIKKGLLYVFQKTTSGLYEKEAVLRLPEQGLVDSISFIEVKISPDGSSIVAVPSSSKNIFIFRRIGKRWTNFV